LQSSRGVGQLLEKDVELIELVYAATTREGTLARAVQRYMELLGDAGGALFHHDSISGESSAVEVVTVDDSQRELVRGVFDAYLNDTGTLENPLIERGMDRLLQGDVLVSDDVMPYEQLSLTNYFKRVLQPLGVRWTLGWLAAGKGQKWVTVTSSRDEAAGEYKEENIALAQLFQRHLGRAIRILELLESAEEERLVLEQSVERVPHAIVLINDSRKVEFANPAAERLVKASPSITLRDRVFTVGRTRHEQNRFDQWWTLCTSSLSADGAVFEDPGLSPVWQIEVSRVGSVRTGHARNRRWMLTLKRNPTGDELPIAYLQSRFGLTKAEARVCRHLCLNGDAVSTAEALNLSPHTVRSHLKSAFKKTDSKNQVQLAINLVREGMGG
jgi:DNA-binding CsgD family transcriptional regulator